MTQEGIQNAHVLTDIAVAPDIARIANRLRFYSGSAPATEQIHYLIKEAETVARAKAAYSISEIAGRTAGSLEIDGVPFTSPLLRFNLATVQRVYPYLVTTGNELEELPDKVEGEGTRYALAIIQDLLLEGAVDYLREYLVRQFRLDYLWSFSPGEWQAWPLIENYKLLSLLGDAPDSLGVTVQKDGLLVPKHSRAGIFYYAEAQFESCQVCPVELCMMRRAPYSPLLATKYKDKARKPCGTNVA